jgi:enoyl-CoA hydratase/carnithine racemase
MTTTEDTLVATTLEGPVAVLTLQSRPHNLLDDRLAAVLVDALTWAEGSGARAVLLESGLRHFSAGADLDAMLAAVGDTGRTGWPLVGLLEAFERSRLPIVAAIHGVCVGGGLELALASDLVIAAASAKIGSVEATVGLHPLMGGIQRVAQRAGSARAKEMAMLGRRYDAATLERWNVINRVVDDEGLPAAARVLAREVAGGPGVAHAATKQLVNIAVAEGTRAADEAMEDLQVPIFRSADFRTGVTSLHERGPGQARFEGR